MNDAEGDAGPFLVVMLDDEAKAIAATAKLKESGLHSVFRICEYGLHIYYNIPSLVNKVPLSPAGNPWSLAENAQSQYPYDKGTCPASDALFARSILIPIPSKLTREQEEQAVEAIREAVAVPAAGGCCSCGQSRRNCVTAESPRQQEGQAR